MNVNEVRVFALASTGVTLTAFWHDSDIIARLVSKMVSAAAPSSPTHCVTTHWKWSQLPDSNRRARFRHEEKTDFTAAEEWRKEKHAASHSRRHEAYANQASHGSRRSFFTRLTILRTASVGSGASEPSPSSCWKRSHSSARSFSCRLRMRSRTTSLVLANPPASRREWSQPFCSSDSEMLSVLGPGLGRDLCRGHFAFCPQEPDGKPHLTGR